MTDLLELAINGHGGAAPLGADRKDPRRHLDHRRDLDAEEPARPDALAWRAEIRPDNQIRSGTS